MLKQCLTLFFCVACVVVALADTTPAPTPPDASIVTPILVHNGHSAATKQTRRWLSLFKVPPPPGYIDFSVGPCDGYAIGCMTWHPTYAKVNLVPGEGVDAATFAHELGHVFDMYVLSQTGGREKFAAIVGGTWKTPTYEERFAEAYARCVFNRRITYTVKDAYGLKETPQTHQRICALIRDSYQVWLDQAEPHLYGQQPIPAPSAP